MSPTLSYSRRLREAAVRFLRDGRTFYVMHPVKSRIVNVANLPGHDDARRTAALGLRGTWRLRSRTRRRSMHCSRIDRYCTDTGKRPA